MTLTIREAFDLPTPDEIRALGFVVKIEDVGGGSGTAADGGARAGGGAGAGGGGIVESYVLTPHVQRVLPQVLARLKDCCERGEEVGWFVHGSFGSGKSHFMSFVGMLLEGRAEAWAKDHEAIRALEPKHRSWIEARKLLVVRLHMLSAESRGEGFDRIIYRAFNRALDRHGKPAFVYLNVDGVLDEARREAAQYGDAFWRQMKAAGIASSAEHFERRASGDTDRRELLARQYLELKGRDQDSAGLDPNWGKGLRRMAEHAKEQGFGGVVFLLDEMLLWLGEKARQDFVLAINQLNTMVDYGGEGGGKRALPMAVLVARQRRVSDFFPDMFTEDAANDYLGHHEDRFEKIELRDVELRYVCKDRVLKRRKPAEVDAAIADAVVRHGKLLPALIRDVEDGEAYLRDVFPFHPALIEMLIDVSTLMQRERTALRLLYELLVVHYPDLRLGEFLPVGSAFEALFPEAGVEGGRRTEDLGAIHRLYYHRFRPAMARMQKPTEEGGTGLGEARRRVLDQLVKTALLAAVSPRLKGTAGMTVERLVQLNDADVGGETQRGKVAASYRDLVELSRLAPDLQIAGEGGSAAVSVVLRGADFGQLLTEARAKVDNVNQRFKAFYSVMKDELGLAGRPGFGEGEGNEGPFEVSWRGTRRRGSVAIANVRELTNAQFKVREGEELRLLVDYPWDEPGHTVDEDRRRAQDVRARDGTAVTLCWLPRHLRGDELKVITDLAAARYLLGPGQEELLGRLGPSDRQQVLEQAASTEKLMDRRLREILREVYKDEGQVTALISDVAVGVPEPELARNLERFAQALLDRKYPTHPDFKMEPSPKALETLCAWMTRASESPDQMAGYEEEELEVLRKIGQPLEVVDPPGQSRAHMRLDTRYVKVVLDRAESGSFLWQTADGALEQDHGLQPQVRNLFLLYLLRAGSYRARSEATGEVVDVTLDRKAKTGLRIERAALLDAPKWSRARELAAALFGLSEPNAYRSLAAQDRLAGEMRRVGSERKATLEKLHERLASLAGPETDDDRRAELRSAMERLVPLVRAEGDSFTLLGELLTAWPDDASDPLRGLVREAGAAREALATLDTQLRDLLRKGTKHPVVGEEVVAHLAWLAEYLGASGRARPLAAAELERWNERARSLVSQLIRRTSPPPPPPTPPEPEAAVVERLVVDGMDPHDGDDVGAFVGRVRRALQGCADGRVDLELIVRRPGAGGRRDG